MTLPLPSLPNQSEQDALNDVMKNFNQAEQLIQQMQEEVNAYNSLANLCNWNPRQAATEWAELLSLEHELQSIDPGFQPLEDTNMDDYSMGDIYNRIHQDEGVLTGLIQSQEQSIEALDPDFKALDDTLNNLLSCIKNIQGNGSYQDFSYDMVDMQKLLTNLFQAMTNQLQTAKDLYQINNDASLSLAQIEALESDAMGHETQEQSQLQTMFNQITNAIMDFHQQYDNANADKHRFNALEEFFNVGGCWGREARDNQIMNNALLMEQGLSGVLGSLAVASANANPAFTQLNITFDIIKKKMQEILSDPTLSAKGKSEALLGLLMFALTEFQQIGQAMQNNQGSMKQNMSTVTADVAQMNLDDMIMNANIQKEEQANAAVMQMFSLVTTVVMGAIMTVLAPGIGTALLVAAATTFELLEQQGITHVTQSLSSALGSQIGAELLLGSFEMLLTVGGGAIADGLMKQMAQSMAKKAEEAAIQSVQESINKTAEEAVTAAGKMAVDKAQANAEAVIQMIVKNAVNKASTQAVQQYFNQSFIDLVRTFYKGASTQTLQAAMEKATQEAAQAAVENSALFAKLGAKGVTSLTAEDTAEVSSRAANGAVARVSHQSVDKVTEDAKYAEGSWKDRANLRAKYAAGYNAFSSDYLMQMIEAIQKARGKGDDTSFQIFEMFMQVVSQMAAMVVLMKGAGIGSTSSFSLEGSGQRIINILNLIPQMAQSGSSFASADIDNQQAQTTVELQINQYVAEIWKSLLDEMQKDAKITSDAFAETQKNQNQGVYQLSAHLNDGDQAGIQALLA